MSRFGTRVSGDSRYRAKGRTLRRPIHGLLLSMVLAGCGTSKVSHESRIKALEEKLTARETVENARDEQWAQTYGQVVQAIRLLTEAFEEEAKFMRSAADALSSTQSALNELVSLVNKNEELIEANRSEIKRLEGLRMAIRDKNGKIEKLSKQIDALRMQNERMQPTVQVMTFHYQKAKEAFEELQSSKSLKTLKEHLQKLEEAFNKVEARERAKL